MSRLHRPIFLKLYMVAFMYLPVPAIYHTCEIVFSDAGNIVTKKRKNLVIRHGCHGAGYGSWAFTCHPAAAAGRREVVGAAANECGS